MLPQVANLKGGSTWSFVSAALCRLWLRRWFSLFFLSPVTPLHYSAALSQMWPTSNQWHTLSRLVSWLAAIDDIRSPFRFNSVMRQAIHQLEYQNLRSLAQQLGKLVNLPIVADCLTHQRHAPPQVRTATVAERRSNIANAFAGRDHRLWDIQKLLIDDAATSDATIDVGAAALKATRVTSIWRLVIAGEI